MLRLGIVLTFGMHINTTRTTCQRYEPGRTGWRVSSRRPPLRRRPAPSRFSGADLAQALIAIARPLTSTRPSTPIFEATVCAAPFPRSCTSPRVAPQCPRACETVPEAGSFLRDESRQPRLRPAPHDSCSSRLSCRALVEECSAGPALLAPRRLDQGRVLRPHGHPAHARICAGLS